MTIGHSLCRQEGEQQRCLHRVHVAPRRLIHQYSCVISEGTTRRAVFAWRGSKWEVGAQCFVVVVVVVIYYFFLILVLFYLHRVY